MSDTQNTNDPEYDDLLAFASDVIAANKRATEVRQEPPVAEALPVQEDDDGDDPLPLPAPATESASTVAKASDDEEDDAPYAPPPPLARRPAAQTNPSDDDDDDTDPTDFFAASGVHLEREVPDPTKPWMKHHEFKLVRTLAEVEQLVDEAIKVGRCSLDTETQGLDSRIEYDQHGNPRTYHQIVGFCLAIGEAKVGYYIPIRHHPRDDGPDMNVTPAEGVEKAIARLCWAAQPTPADNVIDPLSFKEFKQPPRVVIDFWNAKFDQEMLFPVTGIDWWHPESFEDGMLAAFVIYTDDKSLSLKDKAKELLRDPDGNPYEMIKLRELFPGGRPISFPSLAPDEPGVLKYACSDAICTRLLGEHPGLVSKVRKKKDLPHTYRIEKQVIQVVRVMERNRVKVDRAKLQALLTYYTQKRDEVRDRIITLARGKGFPDFDDRSLNSPKQLGEFLFGETGLNITPKPEKNEKSDQYKTDADTLERLSDSLGEGAPPALKWVIEYREQEKMLSTYLHGLVNNPDKNDELRFNFKETGAATGRFSAPQGQPDQGFSGIPIHGIPATSSLREAFVARPGYTLVKSDYAGQELRIAANVSGEPVWIKEFQEGSGDLHTITARAFFNVDKPTKEQRKMGKIANFALVYGGGPQAIMRATGCDKIEASRRKQAFDRAVPTFAKWIKNQHEKVRKNKGIWTPFGRWIAIPDIDNQEQFIRAACERHSTNYPIQGGGADVMKIALILLHKEFYRLRWLRTAPGGDDSVRMLLTVHDEIVFEIRNERIPEALPIIVKNMEAPYRFPKPPASPEWRVPLIVEPLLGESWAGVYNWDHLTIGKKGNVEKDLKNDEKPYYVQVGDKMYQKVPPWLEGILRPGWETNGDTAKPVEPAAPPVVPVTNKPALVEAGPVATAVVPAPTPFPVGAVSPPPQVVSPPPQVVSPPPPAAPVAAASGRSMVSFRINNLTRDTVRIVMICCISALDIDNGSLLRIVDVDGQILVDPSLGIRVDPDTLQRELRSRTLSDGGYWREESTTKG